MPGENLDISSDPASSPRQAADSSTRKFIGVTFVCCDVYARVYVNPEGNAYDGNCPRCAKRLHILIGPGGTDTRFFTAQ